MSEHEGTATDPGLGPSSEERRPGEREPGVVPSCLLMTADTIGGVWSCALELCRALEPYGTNILLATSGGPLQPAQRADVRKLANVTVAESEFRLEWMAEPWQDVERAGQWLLDLASRLRPDLVHLHSYCHAALPFAAPVLISAHAELGAWWRAVRGDELPPALARYREEVARGLRSAGHVVAPTRVALAALEADYGPLSASTVIPWARSASAFQPREKGQVIVAAGRLWDEAKNLALLESAAPHLSWPVVVAGPTAGPDGTERAHEGVVCLGTLDQEELAALYAGAAIFALPARFEPGGMAALEAALSGCALVLGDLPALRELWEGAAIFVPPDDLRALVDTIEGIIEDPGRRARLGACARTRALGFSQARLATSYLEVYRQLCTAPISIAFG